MPGCRTPPASRTRPPTTRSSTPVRPPSSLTRPRSCHCSMKMAACRKSPERAPALAAGLLLLLAPAPARAQPSVTTPAPAPDPDAWTLETTGYLQVDSVAWSEESVDQLDPNTGEPLNQTRFAIRRGRVRATAHRDALSGSIEIDGNTNAGGATARLLGAQVGWTYPAAGQPLAAISAGLFKIPFGAEVPASERDKPFLEPPAFARALFP